MAPAIKTRCECEARTRVVQCLPFATRPALALFAAHSARCLRAYVPMPACLRACAASRPACQSLRDSSLKGARVARSSAAPQ